MSKMSWNTLSLAVITSFLWITSAEAQQLRIRSDGTRPEGKLNRQPWSRFEDGYAHASGSGGSGKYGLPTTRVLIERLNPRARITMQCNSSITEVKYEAIVPVADKLLKIKEGGREGVSVEIATGEEADQRREEIADGLVAYLGGIFKVESSGDADMYYLKVEQIQIKDDHPTFSGSLRTTQKETGLVEGVDAIVDGRADDVLHFGLLKLKVVAVVTPQEKRVGWVALAKVRPAKTE
jgi:hypothetical protein